MGKGKNKAKKRQWSKKLKKAFKIRKPTAPPTISHKSKKDYNRKENKKINLDD